MRKSGIASCSGLVFLIEFYLHVLGQMVTQVLMIVAIWGKVEEENPVPGEDLHISGFLLYMIVGGYILPFVGTLMFAVFNYNKIQKFPIGVTLDLEESVMCTNPQKR